MENVNYCQEKYNISMETWTYFVDNYMTLPDPSIESHRCFVQCIMDKRRMLKNNRNRDFDKKSALKEFLRIIPYLEEQKKNELEIRTAKEEFDDCMDTPPGGGRCMQNYLILKCLQAMLKKHRIADAFQQIKNDPGLLERICGVFANKRMQVPDQQFEHLL
ncbi:uncharacterized protein [Periplaneta americana]|uniref:uncharacterized protein n=1 Tax=Periplaneta americana TaxID=6978 RepID=UPI0037E7BC68